MRVMMKTRIAYRSTQVEGTSRYTIVRHWMFVMGLSSVDRSLVEAVEMAAESRKLVYYRYLVQIMVT